MKNNLRTYLQHANAGRERARGTRVWSAVEILTSTWFFVEVCYEPESGIQRWVATSINEAVNFQKALKPSGWARIFVCLRAPLCIREATLFEEIDEAYQLDTNDSFLFQLATGLSYVVGAETVREVLIRPRELQLIYNRKKCSLAEKPK